MHNISRAFHELLNLQAAAKFHKEHCQHPDCNVSLHMLLITARRLHSEVWPDEREEVDQILNDQNMWT